MMSHNLDKRSGLRWPLFVGLAFFALYCCTLSKQYGEGEDSADYVCEVTDPESSRALFLPNHLAYNAINRCLYLVSRSAGYEGNASLTMRLLNCFCGAIALALLARIFDELGVTRPLAACWIVATATAFGFWAYSTIPECYIPPIVPLLLAISELIRLPENRFSLGRCAWIGCLAAVTTLLHQQHVLFVASIAVTIAFLGYRCRSDVPLGTTAVGLLIYCAVSAAIIGTAYFAVAIGIYHFDDLARIIRWSKGHARNGLWVPWSFTNPIQSLLVGIPRTIFGLHFLYGYDQFYTTVSTRFPDKLLLEERFIGQHVAPAARAVCVLATIVAGAATIAIARTLLFRVDPPSSDRTLEVRLLVARTITTCLVASYFIFNSLWEPANVEFWILPLPVAAIALALAQTRRRGAQNWWPAVAVFALSIFVVNGAGSILPQRDLAADYWYQANRFLIENASAQDAIITDDRFISNMYLRVYTKAHLITPLSEKLEEKLEKARKREYPHVWVSSWTTVPPPAAGRFKTGRRANPEKIREFAAEIKDALIERNVNEFQTVWEIVPAESAPKSQTSPAP